MNWLFEHCELESQRFTLVLATSRATWIHDVENKETLETDEEACENGTAGGYVETQVTTINYLKRGGEINNAQESNINFGNYTEQ